MSTFNFSTEFQLQRWTCVIFLMFSILLSSCNPSELATGEISPVDFQDNPQVTIQEADTADYVVFEDSFEREELLSDPKVNNVLGYRGFLWDYGSPVVGPSGFNIQSVILDDQDKWGEASEGHRSLYMYGREGKSIHNLYLITKSFDLKNVDELEIEFDYISFRLNDSQERKDGVEEYLKLELCTATPEDCGVGPSLNSEKIQKGPWKSIFTHMPMDNSDQKFNGKNHKRSDWNRAKIRLDITQFAHKDHFTFRFNARLRDGLKKDSTKYHFEDGVTIDRLRARAKDFYDEQDPVEHRSHGNCGDNGEDHGEDHESDNHHDDDHDEGHHHGGVDAGGGSSTGGGSGTGGGSSTGGGTTTPPSTPDPQQECDAQGGVYLGDGICIIETA